MWSGEALNKANIGAVLASRNVPVRFGFTGAGIIAGVPMRWHHGEWIVSLVPIDDDSDMRFCDFLESEYRKASNDKNYRPSDGECPLKILE